MNILTTSEIVEGMMKYRGGSTKRKDSSSSDSESSEEIEDELEEHVDIPNPPEVEAGFVLQSKEEEKTFIQENRKKKCAVVIVWDNCGYCHNLIENLNKLANQKEDKSLDDNPFDRVGIMDEKCLNNHEKKNRNIEYFPHIRVYNERNKRNPNMKDSTDAEELMRYVA